MQAERWRLLLRLHLRLRLPLLPLLFPLLLLRFLLFRRQVRRLLQTLDPMTTTKMMNQPLASCKPYPQADGLAPMPAIAKEQKSWYWIGLG